MEGHTNWIKSVAYSPDGQFIVSGSNDNTVRVWNADSGQPVGQPLEGHTNEINSVAYSPDGQFIVSGSDDNTVRIGKAAISSLTVNSLYTFWKLHNFSLLPSGWIKDSHGNLVVYIAPWYKDVNVLCNPSVACFSKSVIFDINNFVSGPQWQSCYSPS